MSSTAKKNGSVASLRTSQVDDEYVAPAFVRSLATWHETIIVEAPAGYGKTKLLDWLGRRAVENGRAVGRVSGRASPTQAALDEAAELAPQGDRRPLLIVDDAHLLETDAIGRLARLIDRDGKLMQFAIASRESLPIGVARRVVAREALLATAAELALDDEGIAYLLAAEQLIDPSLRSVIARLADGWPAGVRMAIAQARKGATDRTSLLKQVTRCDGTLERFLAEEVLFLLDPASADLLAVLSTLSKFSPALVQAVTGMENGEAAIAALERRGLFIRAVHGDWRSVNPMVGACFEARMRRIAPGRSRDLHLAAASWHENERQLSDAIGHAFAGGDAERAADLMDQSSSTHERIGRWRAYTDWTTRLSEDMLDRHATIRLEAAPAHAVLFEFDAARGHLAKLTNCSSSWSAAEGVALIGAQAILAAFADQREDALDAGERGRASVPQADAYTHGVFYMASALGRIARGEIAEAQKLAIDARAIHERGGSAFGATVALAISGLTHAIGCKLDEAVALWQEGARLIRPSENAKALEAVANGYLPLVLYEWNEFDEAQASIANCMASSVEVALPDAIASIYATACRIAAARGDAAGVEHWSDEGMTLAVRRQWARLYYVVAWERITFALRQEQMSEARRLRKQFDRDRRFAVPSSDGLDVEGNCATLRYDLRFRGDRAALAAIRSATNRARSEGRLWRAARLLTIEADGRECLGDRAGALRALRRALELGQSGRLIRTFVDEGPSVMALVLRIATEEAQAPKPTLSIEYLDDILDAGGAQRKLSDDDPRAVEALSKRESEVLVMVAAGLSNRVVGDRLFMSENTVKWHLQHVFAKLGVTNRTSAILVARGQGFID